VREALGGSVQNRLPGSPPEQTRFWMSLRRPDGRLNTVCLPAVSQAGAPGQNPAIAGPTPRGISRPRELAEGVSLL
jgi:hypothetical protein